MKSPPTLKIHERQPSPPQPLLPPLPSLPPPQHALLSPRPAHPPSVLPPAFSFAASGSASAASSTASSAVCFQEALRLLYQRHTAPAGLTRPPVSAPPFHPLPLQMLPSGQRKRYSTDEVEGPSRDIQATAGVSTPAAAAGSSTAMSQVFPRRQSESGLYRMAGRMQRHQPGEQMTLKRVRSEHQSLPFSMLGQQRPTGSPLALTMVLGEQVSSCSLFSVLCILMIHHSICFYQSSIWRKIWALNVMLLTSHLVGTSFVCWSSCSHDLTFSPKKLCSDLML